MLIHSDRPTTQDMQVWEDRARYMRLPPREEPAIDAIRRFTATDDATVSVSWGKDSVVTAHLATLINPTQKILWVRSDGLEMPETLAVRDAFLDQHPNAQYEEVTVTLPIMRGEQGFPGPDVDMLGDHIHGRTITGVRGAESKQRAMSARIHGMMTSRTCRPILHWSTIQVFSYLLANDLPIHPAYTMSHGGALTLDDIRVHSLATATLYDSSYWERITRWEDTYYGDTIREELARRACHRP